MDAATLYAVMAIASGPKRMTTQKFPTMAMCEKAAQKMRKETSMKQAIFYCVKRKADRSERAAIEAQQRRRMPQQQQSAQPPQAPAPIGMPRDFYSGTTAPKQ